ncbi:MAG: Gfo/Idh/MocA family oxidoreductase [Candidatus Kapabacteria bacterium]|nr:Gfo/Idh/MocA family oxidoreductase [Ignavibacteriota bacterium]MCW5884404.1 Gfo/Idh/MocA family oxidoreductase [Candidatus Kapabacteria bacterium]
MKNFAILGVAGYIAPRHLQAIKDTGNRLVAAVDPHDSVGILDRYFPDTSFFTEIERFDRHLEKLRRQSPAEAVDFLSICSPNHLHDAHIRLAFRLRADAICEKPLVIKPSNLDAIQELEEEYSRKVYNILQLREHKKIIELKERIKKLSSNSKHEVLLTYITSRGPWYKYSWKGDIEKSGGIATNIGIHFFDMLMWIFGKPQNYEVHIYQENKASGFIELENANIKWFLSIDDNDLPEEAKSKGQRTYRLISIDGEDFEFSEGFTDLHTIVYDRILSGNGYGIDEARHAIELVYRFKNSHSKINPETAHPYTLSVSGY